MKKQHKLLPALFYLPNKGAENIKDGKEFIEFWNKAMEEYPEEIKIPSNIPLRRNQIHAYPTSYFYDQNTEKFEK